MTGCSHACYHLFWAPMKQIFRRQMKKFLTIGTILLLTVPSVFAAPKTYYRYVDNNGVKAIGSSIPPELIDNGYEIVTVSGTVLKTVAPANKNLTPEQRAALARDKRSQDKYDIELRKTYTSLADVDSAKKRILTGLRNNIDILNANLVSVRKQLSDQETLAANTERSGQKVKDDVLKNIQTLRAQEKETLVQISQRETEFKRESDKFDSDRERMAFLLAAEANKP